jgi:hypothetical protein
MECILRRISAPRPALSLRRQVALLFMFFHKRLRGPLANTCFHHRLDPDPLSPPSEEYNDVETAVASS